MSIAIYVNLERRVERFNQKSKLPDRLENAPRLILPYDTYNVIAVVMRKLYLRQCIPSYLMRREERKSV